MMRGRRTAKCCVKTSKAFLIAYKLPTRKHPPGKHTLAQHRSKRSISYRFKTSPWEMLTSSLLTRSLTYMHANTQAPLPALKFQCFNESSGDLSLT